MTSLYPEIEPYDHGFLDVGDGQQLYWEACGNPDGLPALYLHVGPAPAVRRSLVATLIPRPTAETYPASVRAVVLAGVTTTRPSEIDWLVHGMRRPFPAEWDRLLNALPANFRELGVLEGYHRLLHSPRQDIRLEAARNWHDWEAASILLADPARLPGRWQDPGYLLTRARIITHYFRNFAWLDDGILLRDAERLAGIPGVLVQGQLDLKHHS